MIFSKMVHKKDKELSNHSYLYDIAQLMLSEPPSRPASLHDALKKPGVTVIGAVQHAYPFSDEIASSDEIDFLVKDYDCHVDAISVLTEENYFKGDISDIKKIHEMTELPLIQNDIVLSPLHIFQAKTLGASGVVLIASILCEEELKEYTRLAKGLNMDAIVSVEKKEDIHQALRCGARILAISNRTPVKPKSKFNPEKTKYLSSFIPPDVLRVSIGGIRSIEEYRMLKDFKLDGIMIDQCMMRTSGITDALREMKLG
ncbi:MAG: hypothetical protein LBU32_23260 [Clostridiales bacterium]|jgi:indole-3-glycerol phosphate synthase|nr:hypothetical protein [Clostridiales bacterium]